MKSELIEKRIKEYTWAKNFHLVVGICGTVISGFSDNIMYNIMSLFFLGMYWTCAFMHELYTDMKEGE